MPNDFLQYRDSATETRHPIRLYSRCTFHLSFISPCCLLVLLLLFRLAYDRGWRMRRLGAIPTSRAVSFVLIFFNQRLKRYFHSNPFWWTPQRRDGKLWAAQHPHRLPFCRRLTNHAPIAPGGPATVVMTTESHRSNATPHHEHNLRARMVRLGRLEIDCTFFAFVLMLPKKLFLWIKTKSGKVGRVETTTKNSRQ